MCVCVCVYIGESFSFREKWSVTSLICFQLDSHLKEIVLFHGKQNEVCENNVVVCVDPYTHTHTPAPRSPRTQGTILDNTTLHITGDEGFKV